MKEISNNEEIRVIYIVSSYYKARYLLITLVILRNFCQKLRTGIISAAIYPKPRQE